MLDEAALEMMRRAVPRTVVPESLRHRAFVITVPVMFNVTEQ
jgi:outer membrane biosynthesis protein TonB